MHVLRRIDRNEFPMDFLVHTTAEGSYDSEIESLGATIVPCVSASNPIAYAREFSRLLLERGPYDIIHSHLHHFSGQVLRLAHRAGTPARIAHSHNDTRYADCAASATRKLYLSTTARWIKQHATAGLAASNEAAVALFGAGWQDDPRWTVMHYSIGLDPFRQSHSRDVARKELGIPSGAFVVGHVGRFHPQKNHDFLMEILAEVLNRDANAWALLVGDGPLRPAIERKIRALGIADRTVLAGVRGDIPRLMMAAIDVLAFPSFYEGLPVTLIEAQAAGLPCVISDVITRELGVAPDLIRQLSTAQPASDWAREIVQSACADRDTARKDALLAVENSSFNADRAIRDLEAQYGSAYASAAGASEVKNRSAT